MSLEPNPSGEHSTRMRVAAPRLTRWAEFENRELEEDYL
jgi:hypothetical protein